MKNRTPQQQAFIDLMSKLESNSGQNTEHALLSDGTNAVGKYGIKPTTAQEMLNRNPSSEYENPKDKFEMQDALESNPKMQEDVMTMITKHLLDKNQGQLTPAAVGHFKGHNASMESNEDKLKHLGAYDDRIEQAKQELGIMPNLKNLLKGQNNGN
jgi:hypothetical protein